MLDLQRHPAWWGLRPPAVRRSVVGLMADGALDAELAALLWVLIEARVPIVVAAGRRGAGKTTLLTALLDFLPPATPARLLAGATEEFSWLPEATELGWPRTTERVGPGRVEPARPGTVLLAPELSPHLPAYTWGAAARTAIRALQLGYGLATTTHANSLLELLEVLQAPPVELGEDELRRLGVVLILRLVAPGRRRIVVAHYLRPLERDRGGHLQRRPPVVLAAWEATTDTFEHFAWGVTPELALRVGRTQAELEREQVSRAEVLRDLRERGVDEVEAVRRAIAAYAAGAAGAPARQV